MELFKKESKPPVPYSEEDIERFGRKWRQNGTLPPKDLISEHVPGGHLSFITQEQLRERNRIILENKPIVLYEAPKPIGRLRKTLSSAAIVFAAGIHF